MLVVLGHDATAVIPAWTREAYIDVVFAKLATVALRAFAREVLVDEAILDLGPGSEW